MILKTKNLASFDEKSFLMKKEEPSLILFIVQEYTLQNKHTEREEMGKEVGSDYFKKYHARLYSSKNHIEKRNDVPRKEEIGENNLALMKKIITSAMV